MYYAEEQLDQHIRETYFPNREYLGCMVEVGAGPVDFYSMSKHFIDSGWRAILVEPNPKFVAAHKILGHEVYAYACSSSDADDVAFNVYSSGWRDDHDGISYSSLGCRYPDGDRFTHSQIKVTVRTLNHILNIANVQTVDFVFVDVEGWELDVMRGFDVHKYNPKIIVLENVHGDQKYVDYMDGVGYKLDSVRGINYIFSKAK